MSETIGDRFRREHPWHWRWAKFKLMVEDILYDCFGIDIDW